MIGGVKAMILLLVGGCASIPTNPNWVSGSSDPNNFKIEKAIRKSLKKPTGELTESDLEKVTRKEVEPVLKWVCVECHEPKKQKGKFRPRS